MQGKSDRAVARSTSSQCSSIVPDVSRSRSRALNGGADGQLLNEQSGVVAQRIDVTLAGLHDIRRRIERQQLESEDWPLVHALVSNLITRTEARLDRARAKMANAEATNADDATSGPILDAAYSIRADDSSESSASANVPSSSAPAGPDAEDKGSSETLSSPGENASSSAAVAGGGDEHPDSDEEDPRKPKRPGHGRNGAKAFRNARDVFYTLAAGVIGAVCEVCGLGKMYRYREKIIIRIVGQPLFAAELHHYEQARCRSCGRIVRAIGAACVHEGLGSDYVRYDWSACAMLLVMHYFGGLPFKRIDSLHQGWGVPMPDANQWELANASDDRLLPLYRAYEQHAIRKATNFRLDDTGSVVIALQKQINAELAALRLLGESTRNVRTGINATGLYWETPDGPIILFYTGRHHAGEIVDQFLRHRPLSSPKLIKCTDGASKNFDHVHGDKLVESTCNAHALLKFRAIKDKYPAEYAKAGSVYKQVFDNDDQATTLGLTPVDRMLYHQKHSEPLMEELKAMCKGKIASKLVEPNSHLWEPLTFVLNQWDRLVRFCKVPGVPLDTNLVEQALIMPVRYLAGSFNYHTEDGAVVGDHLMSLIATARANDVEPVAYLAECLRCHEDLAERPDYYLPWIYRERMKNGDAPSVIRSRAAA